MIKNYNSLKPDLFSFLVVDTWPGTAAVERNCEAIEVSSEGVAWMSCVVGRFDSNT